MKQLSLFNKQPRLIHGDCLEEMKNIPDGSVDMVLTDPPYGTTACKWDTVVDLELMWKQLNRVIKSNGAIVLFGSEPFSSALRMSNIKNYKYDWYWRKPKGTGHLNAKKMPMKDTEVISVFQKSIMYNPQFTKGTPYKNKAGDPKLSTSMTETYGKYSNFRNDNNGVRYPKTGIDFQVVERGSVHPTQKPVPLMEYLIKTYTNENETVLDFTTGSGTTGVACKNLNRNFIGIELDKAYFDIATKRIRETT